ncbi:MAG: hypothetical protein KDD65_04075 [Bacteroidetes bacterium]|nr:hypothetical protein [Bacteroidota bacterium]
MGNAQRLSRLFKSGSARPVIVGAAVGAGVGLLTGPLLLATAIGGVVGAIVATKK